MWVLGIELQSSVRAVNTLKHRVTFPAFPPLFSFTILSKKLDHVMYKFSHSLDLYRFICMFVCLFIYLFIYLVCLCVFTHVYTICGGQRNSFYPSTMWISRIQLQLSGLAMRGFILWAVMLASNLTSSYYSTLYKEFCLFHIDASSHTESW